MRPIDDDVYMGMAILNATRSKAVRRKVGAIMVTEKDVILSGYNGTPSGRDNTCEYHENGELVTKPNVIHAELNCVLKAAKEGVSCVGATIYVTDSPCERCSAMLIQVGIKRLVYNTEYRILTGVDELKNAGIEVEHYGNQTKS